METQIDPVNFVRDWAIDHIQDLYDKDQNPYADALMEEFDEWINLPDGEDEIEYFSIVSMESK